MKKPIKVILFVVFFIFASKYYGFKIVSFVSDIFQDKLCTDTFCINKPKGWIPMYVERKGERYLLNIINEKYLLAKNTKKTINSGYSSDIILLQKNNALILIEEYRSTYGADRYKEVYLFNRECYLSYKSDMVTVVCPNEKIVLSSIKDNESVIYEILKTRGLSNGN